MINDASGKNRHMWKSMSFSGFGLVHFCVVSCLRWETTRILFPVVPSTNQHLRWFEITDVMRLWGIRDWANSSSGVSLDVRLRIAFRSSVSIAWSGQVASPAYCR
jgi:hypothetical protein